MNPDTLALTNGWNNNVPPKMDEKVLDGWIAALRSEDYGQTTGNLCDGFGGYCCLGVVAQINGMDMTKNEENLLDIMGNPLGLAGSAAGTEPSNAPAIVQANLTETTATTLAELNDGGYSFAQIADILEGEREALLRGDELHDHDLKMKYDEDYATEYEAWL